MSAIPFIICDEGSNQYKVTEEACTFLQGLKGHVGVISIAGKYRTGKSLFLNRVILNELPGQGFHVGSTINACTKGIWVYSKTISTTLASGESIQTIVMDSEGIESLDKDATHDCRIFSLALLLSSFFVYNSVGSIDESALKSLSLVTNISKQVRIQANQEATPQELASVFPTFCWVVRDFTLQLVDKNGKSIQADEYLEKALQSTKNQDTDNVRDVIRECFPHRKCVTMVRPCQEEADLQNLFDAPETKMRKTFVDQMNKIRTFIRSNVGVKTFLGKPVSGSMLITMTQSFIKAINQGAVPVIKDSWGLISEIQSRETGDKILEIFQEKIKTYHTQGRLLDSKLLQIQLCQWKEDLLVLYEKEAMQPKTYRIKIELLLTQKITECLSHNQKALQKCMEYILSVLKDDIEDIHSVKDLHACVNKRSTQVFKRITKSDASQGLWCLLQYPYIWKWVEKLESAKHIKFEQNLNKLQLLKNRLDELIHERDDILRKQTDTIRQLKEVHKGEMESIHHEKDKIQQVADNLDEKYNELNKTMMIMSDKLHIQLQKKSKEFDVLHIQAQEHKTHYIALKEENVLLQKTNKTLEKKISSDSTLRLQFQENQKQLQQSKVTISNLGEKYEKDLLKFKNDISEIEKEAIQTIGNLKIDKNKLYKVIENLKKELDTNLQNHQQNVDQIKSRSHHEKQKLCEEIQLLKTEKQKCLSNKKHVEEQLTKTSDLLKREKIDHFQLKKKHENWLISKQKLKDKITQQHISSNNRIRELETDITCKMVNLKSCKRRLSEFEEESKKRKKIKLDVHQAESEIAKQKSMIEWLGKDKTMKEKRITDLTQSLTFMEKKYSNAERQYEMDILKMKIAHGHLSSFNK